MTLSEDIVSVCTFIVLQFVQYIHIVFLFLSFLQFKCYRSGLGKVFPFLSYIVKTCANVFKYVVVHIFNFRKTSYLQLRILSNINHNGWRRLKIYIIRFGLNMTMLACPKSYPFRGDRTTLQFHMKRLSLLARCCKMNSSTFNTFKH